jgi:alpha-D-ribose 1-methylphosphonate 5-triphosphate synthase subunit PhnL
MIQEKPMLSSSERRCCGPDMTRPIAALDTVAKSFGMHLQGGAQFPVLEVVSFDVAGGECVVLSGPSGIRKSSLLKLVYKNYRCARSTILVQHRDETIAINRAPARRILQLRAKILCCISQFLRVIPRVAAHDIVVNAAVDSGLTIPRVCENAARIPEQPSIPSRLWPLPPATFSGGKQQQQLVNIARSWVGGHCALLLDEPTASLVARHRQVVIDRVAIENRRDLANLAISYDEHVRDQTAGRIVNRSAYSATLAVQRCR